jgi:tetratricopeptide (TPR) repeat protein
MPSPHPDITESSDRSNSAPRLVGWKDIAAYLGKTERTVKRWGASRGLPVYRVPGRAKASVYAFPSELNDWLISSSATDPERVESASVPDSRETWLEPVKTQESGPSFSLNERTNQFSVMPWMRTAAAIIGLAGVGLAVAIAAFSAAGASVPQRFRALFVRRQPSSASNSPAVSESDKMIARDFYLKGRYEWNQRTPNSLNRALDLFTQAIVHDPGNAQAYAGLADTYDLLREYSTMSEGEAFPRAIAAAKKAVQLDDTLSEAHRALAFAEMYGSWNFNDAEKEFRRAIELDPKDAQARRWFANAFAVPSRYDEALSQLNKAQELDPSSNATLSDKGLLLANAGHTKEALDLLREVERSAPEFRSPHLYLMRISLATGDYPAFLSEGESAAEVANDAVLKDVIAAAQAGYKRDGGPGLLQDLYAKQKEYYIAGKLSGTWLAKTCVLMGRKQEALHLLEVAYARHETEVLSCLSHPDLLTLKDAPRYKALVSKIHFPMHPVDSNPYISSGSENPRLAIATQLR